MYDPKSLKAEEFIETQKFVKLSNTLKKIKTITN